LRSDALAIFWFDAQRLRGAAADAHCTMVLRPLAAVRLNELSGGITCHPDASGAAHQ
jgi:hypothetical protein